MARIIRRIGQRSNDSLVCMLVLQYYLEDGLELVDIAERLNLAPHDASADQQRAAVRDAWLILRRARALVVTEAPRLAAFLDRFLEAIGTDDTDERPQAAQSYADYLTGRDTRT